MKVDALKEQKALDDKEQEQRLRKLNSIGKIHLKERLPKKKNTLKKEYDEILTSFTTPLTFGLYFPEDRKKGLEYFTDLKEFFITGLIKSEASALDLKKLGIEVRNQSGNIFTANIPFKILKKLATSTIIDYVEIGRPNYPDLGTAIPYAQLDTLHAADPAVQGEGVIIGVVDSALDIYHVNFRNNDGAGGMDLVQPMSYFIGIRC